MKFISSLLLSLSLSLSLSRFACLAADQHVEKVLKVTRKKKGNMAGTNSAKRLHFKFLRSEKQSKFCYYIYQV